MRREDIGFLGPGDPISGVVRDSAAKAYLQKTLTQHNIEAGAPIVDMGHMTVIENGNVASVSFRNQHAEGDTVTVAAVTLSDG